MIALRAISIAIGLISGIVAAMLWKTPIHGAIIIGICLVAIAANVYLFVKERNWKEWPALVIAIAAFACSAPIGYWRAMQEIGLPEKAVLRQIFSQLEDGTTLVVKGSISHESDMRTPSQGDLRIRVEELKTGDSQTWQTIDSDEELMLRAYTMPGCSEKAKAMMAKLMLPESYGYQIQFESKYRSISPPLNPGEFDYAGFLKQNGLTTRLRCYAGKIEIIEEKKGSPLLEIALLAKHSFLATYKQTIRAPSSRLVSAATLGTRRSVENISYGGKDIAQTFRHAGVGHVLAVSGLHVSVVTILLYSLFKMAGVRARVFVPPLIVFLILFCLLTGARPSSVRAVVMNSVVLLALAYFRCPIRMATAVGISLSSFIILLFKPMILFAPSFLLSYGAVLSLILIASTIDRWLHFLRGFSLFFFTFWFVLFLSICIVRFDFFLYVTNCIGFMALLWALILAGGQLNNRYPYFWKIGFEKIPKTLGMFISAQFAIQAGMMVPLSAWFFGQFPVAGVVVNMVAIPAVGVLVQLGMLAGLLGMIPFIGIYLALPFGAADTLVGEFFFRMAHTGATWFPFPATPRPTIVWMIAYYIGIALVLSIESWRVWAQGKLYSLWPTMTSHKKIMKSFSFIPILLIMLPLVKYLPQSDPCEKITCLAERGVPIVAMVSKKKKAVLINAGDDMTGERTIFEVVRNMGPTIIDHAILTGPQPRNGIEGITSLASKMKIQTCHLPVLVDDPEKYLEATGDQWLVDKAQEGGKKATDYLEAYVDLMQAASSNNITLAKLEDNSTIFWHGTSVRTLPQTDDQEQFGIIKAQTMLLDITVHGFRWLIVSDTTEEALEFALKDSDTPYDVLVLPDLSYRENYESIISLAAELSKPKVIIVTGGRFASKFDFSQWTSRPVGSELLLTNEEGAIEVTFSKKSMKLRGYRSGRTIIRTAQ